MISQHFILISGITLSSILLVIFEVFVVCSKFAFQIVCKLCISCLSLLTQLHGMTRWGLCLLCPVCGSDSPQLSSYSAVFRSWQLPTAASTATAAALCPASGATATATRVATWRRGTCPGPAPPSASPASDSTQLAVSAPRASSTFSGNVVGGGGGGGVGAGGRREAWGVGLGGRLTFWSDTFSKWLTPFMLPRMCARYTTENIIIVVIIIIGKFDIALYSDNTDSLRNTKSSSFVVFVAGSQACRRIGKKKKNCHCNSTESRFVRGRDWYVSICTCSCAPFSPENIWTGHWRG